MIMVLWIPGLSVAEWVPLRLLDGYRNQELLSFKLSGMVLATTSVNVPFPHAHAMGRGLLGKDALMRISSTGQERA